MGSQELGMTEWLSTGTNVYTMCPSHRRCLKVKWKSLSYVCLFATPRTIQSMEFSRPEYWSGKPFPSPGDLPNPGIEPKSSTLQADSLPAEPLMRHNQIYVWTFFRSCFKQTISTKMFLRHLEKTEHGLKIHREYIRNILIIKYLLFLSFKYDNVVLILGKEVLPF